MDWTPFGSGPWGSILDWNVDFFYKKWIAEQAAERIPVGYCRVHDFEHS